VPVAGASELSVGSELLASIQIRILKERCVNLALELIDPRTDTDNRHSAS